MAQKNGSNFDLNNTYQIVRELLQDENLPEEDLRVFMRSQMFLELCPDLHRAFVSSENVPGPSTKHHTKEKQEDTNKDKSYKGKSGHATRIEKQNTSVKKQSTDHQQKKPKARVLSSSDSENDFGKALKNVKKEEDVRKKKKKVVTKIEFGDTSDSSASNDRKIVQEKQKSTGKLAETSKDDEEPKKIHPFYLGKMGPVVKVKGKLFESENEEEEERPKVKIMKRPRQEVVRKKRLVREPKPWSFYERSSAIIGRGTKTWKPFITGSFLIKQKRYKLKPLSVVCVDLLNLDTFFHHRNIKGPPACSTSIPLKRHMTISTEKGTMIERLEKLKRESFIPVLNKLYGKSLKDRRSSRDCASSTDGDRGRKEKKTYNQRRVMDSSSDSSSDPMVPKRGMQQSSMKGRGQQGNKDKINARKGSAEYKAEQRKRQLDTIKGNAEKRFNDRGSRKLPWEDPQYFGKNRIPRKDDKLTPKEQQKKRLEEKLKQSKLNAPAISFQKILAQIESANKEAAKKPAVALRIPKLSERRNEYVKPTRPVSVGDVANEVARLLSSESKIDVPLMPSETIDLADYTIRKIAWWILKSEKEPVDDVLIHPELHDHEIMEPWYQPKEDESDSDASTIGCVSDPEGLNKCKTNDDVTLPNIDGDVADEFCGLTSLESRIRRPDGDGKNDVFKTFFKVRPGSNYEKANFEAKCFLCEEKVVGTRELGAHIRSESHKNHFRNYSLKLVTYDERTTPVAPRKVFTAKLVEYTVENPALSESTETKHKKIDLDMQVSDSPGAVIDGEADSPEMIGIKDIPVDELSLPSLTMFDLEADEQQLQAKIALKTGGVWTEEMENRWMKMLEKEARITENYNDIRENYINEPETHPQHQHEWMKFWDRRSCELEAQGKNPDGHDFAAEWVLFWLKRIQQIMKEDVQKQILTMKQSLGLDFESLCKLLERNGLKLNIDEIQRSQKSGSSQPKSATNISMKKQPLEIKVVKPSNFPTNILPSTPASFNKTELAFPQVKERLTNNANEVFLHSTNKTTHKPISKENQNLDKAKTTVECPIIMKDKTNEDKKIELPVVKKTLVAPPPPKLSEMPGSNRDDKRERYDDRRRKSPEHEKRHRDYDKDDRKRNHRRSSSKERRDKTERERDRRHRSSKDSSSDSDRKPSSKKQKAEATLINTNKINSTTDKSGATTSNKKGPDISPSDKSDDLATALEKLREAMAVVENDDPIIGNNLIPADTENVSELEELPGADASDINTSVEMELEDHSIVVDTANANICDNSSPASPDPEPPCPDHKVKYHVETVSPPVETISSAEEGEIDSSVCSINLGVDQKQVSSFIKKKIPGAKNRKKNKRRSHSDKKSNMDPVSDVSVENINENVSLVSDEPLYPSPTKMDPHSIGYHLLAKQRDINQRNNSAAYGESSRGKKDHRSKSIDHHPKRKKSKDRDKHNRRYSTETPVDNPNYRGLPRQHQGKNPHDRKNRSKSKHDYIPPTASRGESSRNFSSGKQNGVIAVSKSLPQPPSAQAWMEDSWEPDAAPIPMPCPLPPPLPPPPPPPPKEDWEDETWDTEEVVKPNDNLQAMMVKADNKDDAPYSPTWDDSSNDAVSKSNDIPCPVEAPIPNVDTTSGRGTGNFRGKKPRGGFRSRKNSKKSSDQWNSTTNANLIPIGGHQTNPAYNNYYVHNPADNPNLINQSWNIPTLPNPNPNWNDPVLHNLNQGWNNPLMPNASQMYSDSQPQGFPPNQYQPGFSEYQYNW